MAKFNAISAPQLPSIACVGTIANIADTKPSESGAYNVTNVKIEPRGGGYGTQFSLLSRPEWLVPGFAPDVELEGNKSANFVYQTNIQGPPGSGISRLVGIAGSEEAADKMVDEIFAAVTTENDEAGNAVSFVPDGKLDAAVRKYAGKLIGYTLVQKKEDTGEVDAAGKKVKIRTGNYELGKLFFPTEDSLKRYRKLAKDRPEDWRVGFDEAF